MLVFAYGSNMDDSQLKKRCPNAEKVAIAVLRGHRLCFPRQSRNRGCGVSSVEAADGHEVWGIVHQLNAADLDTLDRAEGYREGRPPSENGYNRVPKTVEISGSQTEVQVYIAVATENPSAPNLEYLTLIRNGAKAHGLPEAYRKLLDAI